MPFGGQAVVNAIGHSAGVLIFGIFLYLAVQRSSLPRATAGWLPLAAAATALVWNLASLIALIDAGNLEWTRILAAIGFSALSLLPAILFELALGGRSSALCRAGYGLSLIAVAAHLLEAGRPDLDLHRAGVMVITVGFGLLTAIALVGLLRDHSPQSQPATSRLFGTMSLFLLAISFAHFGDGHIEQAWSSELAFHHVGIPFALFILMQEYRFLLADAFIRFLANGVVAALFGVAIARVIPLAEGLPVQALAATVLVGGFAISREAVQALLTRVVFRQPEKARLQNTIQELRTHFDEEELYLQHAGPQIATLMDAPLIRSEARPAPPDTVIAATLASYLGDQREFWRAGVRVILPLRIAGGGTRFLYLGERHGGRPYLSEDLDTLSMLGAIAAEQIAQVRAAEVARLVSQAELRALQAQIHPHFLFNALNTLYGIIPREAAAARRTVLNLADIFRYFLRSDRAFVPLEEELRTIDAYLAIEAHRLGGRLRIEKEISPGLGRELIPVLSIEPLVENAVKHGVAARTEGGTVRIAVRREQDLIAVTVFDSGPGFSGVSAGGAGVGLKNVERRLQLCYGSQSELEIHSSVGGTTVGFRIPLEKMALHE